MIRSNVIFVLPEEIDEDQMEYHEAYSWGHSNLLNSNVLQLSLDDIHLLSDNVFNIISEENESFLLGPGEDTWISSQQVKANILNHLKVLLAQIKNKREIELTNKLIRLLEIAIKTSRNLYFHFLE